MYPCAQLSWLLQFTFVWYHGHWPHQTSTCSESTGQHCDKVPSFSLQCTTASFLLLVIIKLKIIVFRISLLTCKVLRRKQSVYLHSMLARSLPSCPQRSSKGISQQVPRVKTNTNIWRHISLTSPFPHRHRHARWPVDVTELFLQVCC